MDGSTLLPSAVLHVRVEGADWAFYGGALEK